METRDILEITCPSLADFRKHLRITSNDLDAELLAKLRAAILSAEHEISTIIAHSMFTLTGEFSSTIALRWPVREVTSVAVDGVALQEGDDYTYTENALTIADSVTGAKVEVIYEAGLLQVPEDMQAAILLLAGSLFNNPTDRPEERDRTTARNLLRPFRTWGAH
jgi:hypothetical protein